MTQENNIKAENFLKEKYLTANENSQFGFNEVVSILAEYDMKQTNGSEFHKKAISRITDKERELMVKILDLKSTLNELAEHNANYFGDSVMREIIEKSLLKCDGKF